VSGRRVELDAAGLAAQRANLAIGSVVLPAAGDPIGAELDLELVAPDGGALHLEVRAVYDGEGGTAYAVCDPSGEALARIAAWVDASLPDDGDGDGAGSDPAAPVSARRRKGSTLSPQARVRGLTLPQQLKVAREGELAERVALERMYGKAVWEILLRNPRLTIPEVTHLARNGTMPRILLELIWQNAGWLQSPQVRRALLANNRLPPDGIERVLRATPKAELRLVPSQTAYSPAVRSVAKRLIST
jgi:hypothetical protein